MYQKHLYVEKGRYSTGDAIPFLATTTKFAEDKGPVRTVFKGKQFMVQHPKKIAGGQEGLFTKHAYAPHEFDDSSGVLKAYPLDGRKLGFYTRMPPARDQFTKTLETERYREAIEHEYRHLDHKILAASRSVSPAPRVRMGATSTAGGAAEAPDVTSSTAAAGAVSKVLAATSSRIHAGIEVEGPDVRERIPAHMYDHVHGRGHAMADPHWQKTSRDVWYHTRVRASHERRRIGTHALTSEAYGYGVSEPSVLDKPAHGKRGAYKDFYDHGHLDGRGLHHK